MPVPGSIPSPSGVPVVSDDGRLTATPDGASASIVLKPDFHALGTFVGRVTVLRTNPDGTEEPVRGLDFYSSPMAVTVGIDHWAPIGVPLTYRAQAFTDAGALVASSTPVATMVPANTAGFTWVKSLRKPAMSVAVYTQTYPDWSSDIPQGVFYPDGAESPIVASGRRRLPTGTWTLLGLTAGDNAALRALFAADGGGPYLLQPTAASGDPDVFVTVGALAPARVTRIASHQDRTWALPMTQIARPKTTGSLVVLPAHSAADVAARYGVQANYPRPPIDVLTA